MSIFKKKEKEPDPNACNGCGEQIIGEGKLLNGKRFCSTACMLRKR